MTVSAADVGMVVATPTIGMMLRMHTKLRNRDSTTPLAYGLEVFGDPWSVLLMQEAFLGVRRFDDFQENLRIARNTLTDRLRLLEEHNVFRREVYQQNPVRLEYRLTDQGRDAYGYAVMLMFWGDAWLNRTRAGTISLSHIPCGARLEPVCRCSACKVPVVCEEVTIDSTASVAGIRSETRRVRYSSRPEHFSGGRVTSVARALAFIGDRWSFLLVWLAFANISRPERFHDLLGIARPILSSRLTRLVENGILKRSLYSERPPRYEYSLSQKGKSLLPALLTFFEWSNRWFGEPDRTTGVVHTRCSRPLHVEVVCKHCGQVLKAKDGRFVINEARAHRKSATEKKRK
ncbi:winged helix-turn-helix transcriptional regulator [Bradyrhizobium sp. 14AA]